MGETAQYLVHGSPKIPVGMTDCNHAAQPVVDGEDRIKPRGNIYRNDSKWYRRGAEQDAETRSMNRAVILLKPDCL